jgi:glycosyltransferase involved in cell wall biosynthesis
MSKTEADPGASSTSWTASLARYLRYGWSTMRQEGLGYFIKRSSQVIWDQLSSIFRSLDSRRAAQYGDRLLEIEDIQATDITQNNLLTASSSQQSAQADLVAREGSRSAGFHDRLVQLGSAAYRQHLPDRQSFIEQGRQLFAGKKVLFVSPIRVMGGGTNLIFLAAGAMRHMGVEAQVLNLKVHQGWFEEHFPKPPIPVLFSEVEQISTVAASFDAVIATSNPTVAWISPALVKKPGLKVGYYIQDYEPYFYAESSHEYTRAAASYTLIPSALRMVTTPWIAEQLMRQQHLESTVVGAHLDTDLFHPRLRSDPSWPDRPLRIAAMIRPSTPRRNPRLTMQLLRQVSQAYSSKLEIRLFGCELSDPGFSSLPIDFPWQLAGQLRSTQVANLFNEADIFVDFSEFQALGLTALEAMASGLAVVLPQDGGTGVYARNGENCLVVDTHDQQACLSALRKLVEDESLRQVLQENAITTAARFYAELPATNMLRRLFQG